MGKRLSVFLTFVLLSVCFVSCMSAQKRFMQARSLVKIEDYLYEITYDKYSFDYALAEKYFRGEIDLSKEDDMLSPPSFDAGACSAMRNGNFFGRTYDSYFDETAEYVVRVAASEGRHASIGIAGGLPGLTESVASSMTYDSLYKILPFCTFDGINDCGVVCAVNTVPCGDLGRTTGTDTTKEGLYAPMAVRFVLDNASSAEEAVILLANRNIYSVIPGKDTCEYHFMIADKDHTYVIEFIGNEMCYMEDDVHTMTNFYLSSFMDRNVMGRERHDILQRNFRMGQTKRGMINLMKKVYYTQAYDTETNPFWFSEYSTQWGKFAHGDVSDGYTEDDYFNQVKNYNFKFKDRVRASVDNRSDALWQTVHLSVYDIQRKILTVIAQENNTEFEFMLNKTDED